MAHESSLDGDMDVDVTQHVIDYINYKLRVTELAWLGATGQRVRVPLNVDKAAFNAAVTQAFPGFSVVVSSLPMFEAVMKQVITQHPTTIVSKAIEQLKRDFTRPYQGDLAPAQFEEFIGRCWNAYCEQGGIRLFPYTTLVQSSGFGKSRLLLELATRTKNKEGVDAHMRVLYTCVRDVVNSTGYPTATPKLQAYFFPHHGTETELVDRLCRLFDYAMNHWDTVGDDWIDLFTDSSRDASVRDAISGFAPRSEPAIKPCQSFTDRRVLVFAVDEARTLFAATGFDNVNWLRCLQRALSGAYKQISAKYGCFAGSFAVLVDSNPQVPENLPPATHDSSSRGLDDYYTLFPSFVLTHTMDIAYDALIQDAAQAAGASSIGFYQQQLRDVEGREASLVSMGRPLWKSRMQGLGFKGVINLAAIKLLGNSGPESSFNEATMGGVASMLCRLGIRAFSSSAFASHSVAEFMAVLSYVTKAKYRFISAYASEPILTFGAARVWYQAASEDDHHAIPCDPFHSSSVGQTDAAISRGYG